MADKLNKNATEKPILNTGETNNILDKKAAIDTPLKAPKPKKAGAIRNAPKTTPVEFRDKAMNKARSAANEGKAKTGDAIGSLSRFIETSATSLDQNLGRKYGDYARSTADVVANLGDKINTKNVEELVEDARGYVRKSPAVAIGAAAAVGFLLSRFIKAGSGKDEDA